MRLSSSVSCRPTDVNAEKRVPHIGCIGLPGAAISQICLGSFFVMALLHSAAVTRPSKNRSWVRCVMYHELIYGKTHTCHWPEQDHCRWLHAVVRRYRIAGKQENVIATRVTSRRGLPANIP